MPFVKQFLAKPNHGQLSPPRKRRKTSDNDTSAEEPIVISSDHERETTLENTSTGPPTSTGVKPNFFDDVDLELGPSAGLSSSKPHSYAGPSTSYIQTSPSSSGAKPVSTSSVPKPKGMPTRPAASQATLDCPICAKSLKTDNAGLNEHIDFCLSRDAIKQASAAGDRAPSIKGGTPLASTKGKGKVAPKRPNPFSRVS